MRPIFVGNFGYGTRQSELERLFSKYGRIERVDMKNGIPFVFSFVFSVGLVSFIIVLCILDAEMNNKDDRHRYIGKKKRS